MTQFSINPQTTVGKVNLIVKDLPMMTAFYEDVIGLTLKDQTAEKSILGTPDEDIIALYSNPAAESVEPSTGLFHLAILVPDRPSLAHWLYQFLSSGYHLPGASDHGVSEALYLSDPEGNGIEIYHDRPRSEWPTKDGQIQMFTERLNFDSLMKEAPQTPWQKMADKTTLGHVHLKVHNIPQSVDFYTNVLGFDIISDEYPGAGFVSAGGYHHHLGMNTWQSVGASPLPPNATGLASYSILFSNQEALDETVANIEAAGIEIQETADGPLLRDPAGIAIILQTP
jgi:catechol 2,3-dioxygenase